MMDLMERLRDFSFGSVVLRLVLAMICGGVPRAGMRDRVL